MAVNDSAPKSSLRGFRFSTIRLILCLALTGHLLRRFDNQRHIVEKSNVGRSEHVEVAILAVHSVVESNTWPLRSARLEQQLGWLAALAELDQTDVDERHTFEANDFVQM